MHHKAYKEWIEIFHNDDLSEVWEKEREELRKTAMLLSALQKELINVQTNIEVEVSNIRQRLKHKDILKEGRNFKSPHSEGKKKSPTINEEDEYNSKLEGSPEIFEDISNLNETQISPDLFRDSIGPSSPAKSLIIDLSSDEDATMMDNESPIIKRRKRYHNKSQILSPPLGFSGSKKTVDTPSNTVFNKDLNKADLFKTHSAESDNELSIIENTSEIISKKPRTIRRKSKIKSKGAKANHTLTQMFGRSKKKPRLTQTQNFMEGHTSILPNSKWYLDGGESVTVENYNVRNIDTEEVELVKKVEKKVLLELIEDEILIKLDNELQNQNNNGQLKTTKTSKKSIKKNEKVPKQLDITLQSSSTVVKTADKNIQTESKCTTNAGVQTEDIHCFKCNGDLINVNVGERAISQSTMTAMEFIVNESNDDFTLADPSNDNDISKRDPSVSKPTSRYETLTGSFDDLNFETQELTKTRGVILRNPEIISDTWRNMQNNVEYVLSTGANKEAEENLLGSVPVCSLDTNPTYSKNVNVKVRNGGTRKRFKRIRMFTSDSDDSEGEVEARRKCNRFIRGDLTIEVHTNTEGVKGQTSALDSQNSNNINYDDYLSQVMKKYDCNFFTDSLDTEPKVPATDDDIIAKCEGMIERANKKFRNIEENNNNSSFASTSRDTLQPKHSVVCGKNPQSASFLALSGNLAFKGQKSNDSEDYQWLKDSLNAADLEVIEEQTNLNKANNTSRSQEEIRILENVKIKSQDERENMNKEEDSLGEWSISELDNYKNFPIHFPTNPRPNTKHFEFDIELPHISFDFEGAIQSLEGKKNDGTSSCNIQYDIDGKEDQVRNNLSLTPDNLSQIDVNPKSKTTINNTAAFQVNLPAEASGVPPISVKKNQQSSSIEMTQTSKYTPLLSSITRSEPPKQTIIIGTPRQKNTLNKVKLSWSDGRETMTRPIVETKPCIACTRLTKDQIGTISQLTSKKLATYNSKFDSSVTHMIVAVNEDNRVRDYTIKFVSAVAAGIWVLRFNWIEDCLKNNCLVSEEPYEAVDISGLPGPKMSRLMGNIYPLLEGYKFYCVDPFISTTRQEVEEVIKMLKGKVLRDVKDMLEDDGYIRLIIGEGHSTQDFDHYRRWVELYKTVTVDTEWLSKSVSQYKVSSLRPYVWCSEDNLGDCGYPPHLTEAVPEGLSLE